MGTLEPPVLWKIWRKSARAVLFVFEVALLFVGGVSVVAGFMISEWRGRIAKGL